jgi:type I restriction enzyme R subunit
LRLAVEEATAFCGSKGVDLASIEALPPGDFTRLQKIAEGVNALIAPDALRRDFFGHERLVATLYRAVKPDLDALGFVERAACLSALGDAIRAKLNPHPPNISGVMMDINALLDQSIAGHEIRDAGPPALDLSKINFEALATRFKQSTHQNTDIEVLKAAVRARLEKMVDANRSRADFVEKFEALIESYNAGSRSIEELFLELVKLSNSLDDEAQRHVRENLSDEELVIFDILTRPAPELSADERAEVKKVAKDLLGKLKTLLVLSWRQKAAARSQIRLAIEDALDGGLPQAYSPKLYAQKCSAVFEHVYEKYPQQGVGA